jgi:hypothetical protein
MSSYEFIHDNILFFQKLAMGSSSSQNMEVCEEDFPWFYILQWASEVVPSGKVLEYAIADVRDVAIELCANTNELRKEIEDTDVRNVRMPSFLEDCATPDAPRGGSTRTTWGTTLVDFATYFLENMPALAQVRYDLVPRSLSEDLFWHKFFTVLRSRIIKTLVS